MVTLFGAQGIPMVLAGDELGSNQRGNNNAYCQDNEISWVDWEHADQEVFEFLCALSELRRDHPVFRRRRFFKGWPLSGGGLGDVAWLTPAGEHMTDADWNAGHSKAIAVFLNGDAITEPDPRGQRVVDDSFLLLFNAHSDPVRFTLPEERFGKAWDVVLDTAAGTVHTAAGTVHTGAGGVHTGAGGIHPRQGGIHATANGIDAEATALRASAQVTVAGHAARILRREDDRRSGT